MKIIFATFLFLFSSNFSLASNSRLINQLKVFQVKAESDKGINQLRNALYFRNFLFEIKYKIDVLNKMFPKQGAASHEDKSLYLISKNNLLEEYVREFYISDRFFEIKPPYKRSNDEVRLSGNDYAGYKQFIIDTEEANIESTFLYNVVSRLLTSCKSINCNQEFPYIYYPKSKYFPQGLEEKFSDMGSIMTFLPIETILNELRTSLVGSNVHSYEVLKEYEEAANYFYFLNIYKKLDAKLDNLLKQKETLEKILGAKMQNRVDAIIVALTVAGVTASFALATLPGVVGAGSAVVFTFGMGFTYVTVQLANTISKDIMIYLSKDYKSLSKEKRKLVDELNKLVGLMDERIEVLHRAISSNEKLQNDIDNFLLLNRHELN